jgi:GntR family transcriptional regulator of vanillate catabolism
MKNKDAVSSIIRNKIISGEYAGGARLAEIPVAESLGVSRTPIRIAFRALEQEGFLERLPRRGYQVRKVTQHAVSDSVEVRGVLEGLAARLATERGISKEHQAELLACLAQGDAIFADGSLSESDVQQYVDMNRRFHECIVHISANTSIASALALNAHLPMASVSALVYDPTNTNKEFQRLAYAHQQHHAIVEAMLAGQGARAENLMKEHAQAALKYLKRSASPEQSKVVRRSQ